MWSPGRRYVIDIDVSTYPPAFRLLFRSSQGSWELAPAGDTTRVTVRFDASLRGLPGAAMLAGGLVERTDAEVEGILESYSRMVETGRG
jgi:hypothetical protein